MSMILALAALASPAEMGTSALAEADHQHDWSQIIEDGEGKGWVDLNWEATYEADGRVFPVVLLRTLLIEGELQIKADVTIAANCETNQLGMVSAAIIEGAEGVPPKIEYDPVEFDFADNPLHADDEAVLRVACGVGWQP